MTALRHILQLIADNEVEVSLEHVAGLGIALDDALVAYADAVARAREASR